MRTQEMSNRFANAKHILIMLNTLAQINRSVLIHIYSGASSMDNQINNAICFQMPNASLINTWIYVSGKKCDTFWERLYVYEWELRSTDCFSKTNHRRIATANTMLSPHSNAIICVCVVSAAQKKTTYSLVHTHLIRSVCANIKAPEVSADNLVHCCEHTSANIILRAYSLYVYTRHPNK